MATDFFGNNREIKSSNQLSSSEYAVLSVGGKVDLCQSVNISYGQQIRPIYEVGSPSVYYVTGHAEGAVGFGRLAGAGGLFSNVKGAACGRINAINLNIGGGPCFTGGGGVSFTGGFVENISLTMNAGAVEITEGASIRVATMST